MYWKEIPVQIQALDGSGPTTIPLEDRFQKGVDAVAMFDGSVGRDEYLDSWSWGSYSAVSGTAKDAAVSAAEYFNSQFPADFVARIKKLHVSDHRDPTPGSIDHWCTHDKP